MNMKPVTTLFDEAAARHSSAAAIEFNGRPYRYQELTHHIDLVASTLRPLIGAEPAIVGVYLPPGFNQVVAMMAVFKSAAIYLPLDESIPRKRWKQIGEQTRPKVLLIHPRYRANVESIMNELGAEVMDIIELADDFTISCQRLENGVIRNVVQEAGTNPVDFLWKDGAYIFYTSGSTGEGKAILGRHQSLSHFIQWEIREFKVEKGTRISQIPSATFDASLKDILTAICSGATVCIPAIETKKNFAQLAKWVIDSKLTMLQTVPSIFRMLMKEWTEGNVSAEELQTIESVLLAGEVLYPKDVEAWQNLAGNGSELVNLYGTTESTILKTFYRINEDHQFHSSQKLVPVGKAIGEVTILVINNRNELCKAGEVGEIYFKTAYLTKGYINPTYTEKVFVQNPLTGEKDIVYKTGDLGQIDSYGNLEVLGRIDDQIKMNGVRVEPGEIVAAVTTVPGIKQAVVVPRKNADEEVELACYFTGTSYTAQQMIVLLSEHLHRNVMPSYFIWLKEFPLNSNGKVDKRKLPPIQNKKVTGSGVENASIISPELGGIWSEVLGITEIDPNESFFHLGGSSLKALQLISKVYKRFGITLQVPDIFEGASLHGISKIILHRSSAHPLQIPLVQSANHYSMSNAQRGIWLAHKVGSPLDYNMIRVFETEGDLDVEALRLAFSKLGNRHEILRTTFIESSDGPRQVINSAEFLRPLSVIHMEEDKYEHEFSSFLQSRIETAFDLEKDNLIELWVLTRSAAKCTLVLKTHHIISDAWSVGVLTSELMQLYFSTRYNREATLPALRIQYKDYAHWINEQHTAEKLEPQRKFWLAEFSDGVPRLNLPVDFPRPKIKTSKGDFVTVKLDGSLFSKLKAIASEQNCTLFAVLLSTVYAYLHRLGGDEDIVVGTPEFGRDNEELANQIGMYVNNLAIRMRVGGDPAFLTLLARVRTKVIEVLKHKMYPFQYLIEEGTIPQDLGRFPLFDVAIVVQNDHLQNIKAPDQLRITPVNIDTGYVITDLKFVFNESREQLYLSIDYNTALFRTETIHTLCDTYVRLLEQVVKDPQLKLSEIYLTEEGTDTPYAKTVTTNFNFENV
jgi:amino acid adenylation domain-containing protein